MPPSFWQKIQIRSHKSTCWGANLISITPEKKLHTIVINVRADIDLWFVVIWISAQLDHNKLQVQKEPLERDSKWRNRSMKQPSNRIWETNMRDMRGIQICETWEGFMLNLVHENTVYVPYSMYKCTTGPIHFPYNRFLSRIWLFTTFMSKVVTVKDTNSWHNTSLNIESHWNWHQGRRKSSANIYSESLVTWMSETTNCRIKSQKEESEYF